LGTTRCRPTAARPRVFTRSAPVLGRKNYLFCGSDTGGQRAACIYTITETAKMNGINPHAYLADILDRIADHPINKIDALLPWSWK
jgi:transposase